MSFAAYVSPFAALTLKLSAHTLHTCLHTCVKLLLSHCVSFSHFSHAILSANQMLQGATMQQLQQVQVQSQGTPITVNTHAHVHLYVH